MQTGERPAFWRRTAGLVLTQLVTPVDLVDDDAVAEITSRSIGDVTVSAGYPRHVQEVGDRGRACIRTAKVVALAPEAAAAVSYICTGYGSKFRLTMMMMMN